MIERNNGASSLEKINVRIRSQILKEDGGVQHHRETKAIASDHARTSRHQDLLVKQAKLLEKKLVPKL